jgi:DNA-binding beta-propeller fold protein YncE
MRVGGRPPRASAFAAPVDLGAGRRPDLAAARGTLWATASDEQVGGVDAISAASPDTGERVPLPGALAVAADDGAVWATALPVPGVRRAGVVVRIDPRTHEIEGPAVPVGRSPIDVAATSGAAWVVLSGGELVEVAGGRVRARLRVGGRPAQVAAGAGEVWVLRRDDSALVHVDGATGERTGTELRLGKQIDAIAIAGHTLWVAGADSTVTRVDARTGSTLGRPVAVVASPLSLAADAGGAWVASRTDQQAQRVSGRS